jgi:hypothetical protein
MRRLGGFLTNQRGTTAAEFAMVLPVALLFMLGIIDVGRYFWAINRLEKAVQAGTRFAVATDVVPAGLNAETYADFECSGTPLIAGDRICREALGTITCTKPSGGVTCTCTASKDGDGQDLAGSCPVDMDTIDSAAFDRITTRMRVIDRAIGSADVRISYAGSGIGYAGDPSEDEAGDSLSEISPIVTVEVPTMNFRSISLLGYGIRLPGFRYSQTLEDGDGAIAY